MESVLTKSQVKTFGPVQYSDGGRTYRIKAKVRYDDQCNSGHNTFSITGEIDELRRSYWRESAGGCLHAEIAKHFPQLAPLIKWHLCSSDGPMHYVANTVFLASDRDHHGLRKGESRQLRNGKTGQLSWRLEHVELPHFVDADECPAATQTLRYVPWLRIGEGKERELDAARRVAIWPDATDADLTEPGLEARLAARLPALLAEFRKAVESLGFVF